MPSYNCRHPTCTALLTAPGFCARHGHLAPTVRADGRRRYDREKRDLEAKRFYDSAAWRQARAQKLADCPWCEFCRKAWAVDVHHDKPLAECSEEEKTDQSNLRSACKPCHTRVEVRRRFRRRQQDAPCT